MTRQATGTMATVVAPLAIAATPMGMGVEMKLMTRLVWTLMPSELLGLSVLIFFCFYFVSFCSPFVLQIQL
jgi:hypothetical protein